MRLAILLTLLSLSLSACSNVDFAEQSEASSREATGEIGAGGADTAPEDAGGEVAVDGSGAAIVMPKLRFVGPPCQRLTDCLVEFRLDAPYAESVDFDWRTDDTLYLKTPPAGSPPYGQPDVHYLSTSGHIRFEPGETVKRAFVTNINQSAHEIVIGVRMSGCKYGGRVDSCAEYFR